MLTYIVRRLLMFPVIIFLIAVFSFSIIHVVPGDPAAVLLGEQATQEQIDSLRKKLGLDQPVYIQLFNWLKKAVQGDLGRSLFMQANVSNVLVRRIPRTAWLALFASGIVFTIGIPLGIFAAVNHNTLIDRAFMMLTTSFLSIPIFLVALGLLIIFGINLEWLPLTGYVSPLKNLQEGIRHLILPSLSISTLVMAYASRMARSAMLEVSQMEYIKTARAKGLTELLVIFKHMLRPASIPVVTTMGLIFGSLMGGTIISETIFMVPGIGRLMFTSVIKRDLLMMQGIILFVGVSYTSINLLTDILYGVIDPRITYE